MNQSQKLISQPDPEPPALDEPNIIDEPDSVVIDEAELESEVKEHLIETLVNLPMEPTMESSLTTISLRSPDVYDSLQIFLQEIGSLEIGVLVCELIFSGAELPSYVACILFGRPPISADLLRKPISPPPPLFSQDASVLVPRPPRWLD